MQERLFFTALTSLVFLSSCGGGGDSGGNTMHDKDAVVIFLHYPEEICKSQGLIDELKKQITDAKNIITSVEDNNVQCSDYAKVSDNIKCYVYDMLSEDIIFASVPTSCVVGADTIYGINGFEEDMAITVEEQAFGSM